MKLEVKFAGIKSYFDDHKWALDSKSWSRYVAGYVTQGAYVTAGSILLLPDQFFLLAYFSMILFQTRFSSHLHIFGLVTYFTPTYKNSNVFYNVKQVLISILQQVTDELI